MENEQNTNGNDPDRMNNGNETNPGSPEHGEEGTTYSWVNPKLQNGAENSDRVNPWSDPNGQNYWRYSDSDGRQEGGQRGEMPPAYGQNPVKKSGRKKQGKGKKWGTVIAMAVVFGLIAGTVTYGVYGLANRIHPIRQAAVTDSSEQDGGSGTNHESVQNTSETDGREEVTAGSEAVTTSEDGVSAENTGALLSVAEVTERTMPALVTISTMSVQEMQSFFGGTQEYQVEGAGTGVIIGENDQELLIATNNHVVEGAEQLSVGFIDESAISASIKGTDADNDLAVVSVRLSDLPENTASQIRIASIGDSDALALGEQVVAIGNALGYGQSVTSGVVSGLNRSLEFQDGGSTFVSEGLIQTDAAINSGNSGGALLNMRGELVGINEAKSSMSSSGATVDNVGYAIPMSRAEPILEEMMNRQTRDIVDSDEQGTLGVTLTDVTSEYSQLYGMPEGVCFASVLGGGPADQAGARKGDVLTRFDGRTVSSYRSLEQIMQYYKSGETVDIVIQRRTNSGYEAKTLTVTLGDKDVLRKMETEQQSAQNGSEDGSGQQSGSGSDLFRRLFGGN